MSREVMQMALEALESSGVMWAETSEAITALREALEQPQQEPVAWLFTNVQSGDIEASTDPDDKQGEREYWHPSPLYTAPPRREWQGLTEEEVDECYYWKDRQWTTDELVRHVEAKLKEKNA